MPLTRESVLLGINDAKIFPITVDDSTALNYGAGVDVPGISNMKVSSKFIEKELKGDESIIDAYSKLEKIEWSIEHGVVSLAALAIMIGGEVNLTGVTPNQKQTYSLTEDDLPNYFKMEGKTDYADVGDAHFVLYKCKCSSLDYTLKGEDYATISASGKGIKTRYNGKIKDIEFNETAEDIVTSADTTPPTVTVSPSDGTNNAAVGANIAWTFSEAIKASCVTPSNFMVVKATDGTAVAGTLTRTSDTVVTFDPTTDLGAATAYIAIATTNIQDLAGNALAANEITNFATA